MDCKENDGVQPTWTRRDWMWQTTGVLGVLAAGEIGVARTREREKPAMKETIGYCLNTSTIQGQKLDIVQVVEVAAKAGYQAIEPWIFELEAYEKNGGNLKDLGQRIRDRGLAVPSAIGFAEWIVDDVEARKKGLEQMRRDMDRVQRIGGTHIAAPPAGATKVSDLSLIKAAERYRAILELGDRIGVIPQVELWGFSQSLSRISEVMFVALESAHPKACVLLDVYHLYKGGSPLEGLRLLNGSALHVVHFNDYPGLPRASIVDAQRVYPGDGVAPLAAILQSLQAIGFKGYLSLELFNRDYWKADALHVAQTGLDKMRASRK